MTFRALIIGSIVALAIACLGYANDWVFRLPYVASDQMPIIVFGLLFVGLLGINPVMDFVGRKPFSGKEWAVMFSLALVACIIPGPGLLWQFTGYLVWPIQFQQQNPSWQASPDHPALLSYLPKVMLVNAGQPDVRAISGFTTGLATGGRALSPAQVPWAAWIAPLSFYLPLIALGFIGCVCLGLILHRQWADREHLRYPIAEVANEMIRGEEGRLNPLFRNAIFWLGFGLAGLVLLINGLAQYTLLLPSIPVWIDVSALEYVYPVFSKIPLGYELFRPGFYFIVVGLAFLIASEISFSIGISHLVFVIAFFILNDFGVSSISASGLNDPGGASFMTYQIFGAFLGGGIVILYAGRSYFGALLKRTFFLHSGEILERSSVWACRILILCGLAMMGMLHWIVNVDWLMCTLFLLLAGLSFLVLTRINVETGLLFVQPDWTAMAVLGGLFGAYAMGPALVMTIAMLGMTLVSDQRVSLLPLVANALWVSDRQKAPLPKVGFWMAAVLVVALAAGVASTIWWQYDLGSKASYGWGPAMASFTLEDVHRTVDTLEAQGTLATAGQAHGWGGLERLKEMQPSGAFLGCTGIGVGLILLLYAARLRWTWWPIHPVLFMVWGSNVSARLFGSFLAGWLAKTIITRLSGATGYRKARPFFIGMIGGEMVLGLFWMIVGAIYYAYAGHAGPMIRTHP